MANISVTLNINFICKSLANFTDEHLVATALSIAETIEKISQELKPDVIRAAKRSVNGINYLERIEYALGTIGKSLILTDYKIDEKYDIEKLDMFRKNQNNSY